MTKELILAITEHRKFGMLFVPYIITQSPGNSFYSAIEKANQVNLKEVEGYGPMHEQILQLVSEYDDLHIASMFTRKKEEAVEFLKNVDQQVVNDRIRPSIEKRLLKIVKLLHQHPFRIFLKDRQYNKIYLSDQVEIAGLGAEAVFNFNRTPQGLEYFLTIHHQSHEITLRHKKQVMLTMEPCTLVLEQKLYLFENIDYKKLLPFFDKAFISIPKQTEKTYFDKFVYNAVRYFKVNARGFTIEELHPTPTPVLCFQADMNGVPCFLLKLRYDNKLILSNAVDPVFVTLNMQNDEVTFKKLFRNRPAEKNIFELLIKTGLNTPDNIHFYTSAVLSNDRQLQFYETINWMNLHHKGFDDLSLELRQDYYDKKYLLKAIMLNLNVKQEHDWFDVRGNVQLGGFTVAFVKLRKHLLRGIREYELPDGTIAILPAEWFEKYKELFEFGQADGNALKLSRLHLGLINGAAHDIDTSQIDKLKTMFEGQIDTAPALPKGLQATLRPYQLKGFAWMRQLKQNGFGGCLADDMGLGKTLQALTLLLELSHEKVPKPTPASTKPSEQLSLFDAPAPVSLTGKPTSLIIMPSSLIHNWLNEAKKFAPALNVCCHIGGNRTKNMFDFNQYDIVLTTYGLIRNDIDWLKHYKFYYIILDESQAIKNPESKIYKSMMYLSSVHKLVITGTPIENSLTDLWSQMNFVNRGLLGNFTYFKNEFVVPIEKLNDAPKSQKLQGLIHPFILRRTKNRGGHRFTPQNRTNTLLRYGRGTKKCLRTREIGNTQQYLKKYGTAWSPKLGPYGTASPYPFAATGKPSTTYWFKPRFGQIR
jgi:hypothetical protein